MAQKRAGMPGYKQGVDSLGRKAWVKDGSTELPDIGKPQDIWSDCEDEVLKEAYVERMGDYIHDNFKSLLSPYIRVPDSRMKPEMWDELREKLDIDYQVIDDYANQSMSDGINPDPDDIQLEDVDFLVDPEVHVAHGREAVNTMALKEEANKILKANPLKQITADTELAEVDITDPAPNLMREAMEDVKKSIPDNLRSDLPYVDEETRAQLAEQFELRPDDIKSAFQDSYKYFDDGGYYFEDGAMTFDSLMDLSYEDIFEKASNYDEVVAKGNAQNIEGYMKYAENRLGYSQEKLRNLQGRWEEFTGSPASARDIANVVGVIKRYREEEPHNPSVSALQKKLSHYMGRDIPGGATLKFLRSLYPQL